MEDITYRIIYGMLGEILIEKKDVNGLTVVFSADVNSNHFQDFLVWNSQQETPLDYTTPKTE